MTAWILYDMSLDLCLVLICNYVSFMRIWNITFCICFPYNTQLSKFLMLVLDVWDVTMKKPRILFFGSRQTRSVSYLQQNMSDYHKRLRRGKYNSRLVWLITIWWYVRMAYEERSGTSHKGILVPVLSRRIHTIV